MSVETDIERPDAPWRHALLRRLWNYLRADTLILPAFLLLAAGLFVFLKIGSEVLEGEAFGIDRAILLALRDPADPAVPVGPIWLRQAMIDLTALGGATVLTLTTVATAGYLFIIRKGATALFLVLAVSLGAALGTLLKMLFERARPDVVHHLVEVYDASFPSGHAMNSAIVFLTIGALLARTEKDRRPRIFIMLLVLVMTLLVGFSRIYLGVHWPSDVVAGWSIGGVWAILCSLVAYWLQRRRAIESET